MQLSHSGRQMDIPGVHNSGRPNISSTSRKESLHGFLCRAADANPRSTAGRRPSRDGAWRAAKPASTASSCTPPTAICSPNSSRPASTTARTSTAVRCENRARFLLRGDPCHPRARRAATIHLQVKLSAVDRNNVVPWEKKGNVLADTVQVAKWCEQEGADAIHVSTGSLFPHPLNPPGDFSFETIATTYDAMISSGVDTFRNFLLFRYRLLRPIFRWVWFRMKKGLPIEGGQPGGGARDQGRGSIPVLNTGGYQTASVIRDGIESRAFDGVAIARSLVANNDLVQLVGRRGTTARRGPAPIATSACSMRRRIRWVATSSPATTAASR